MQSTWQYRNIATISKTHGRKGEVLATAREGLPFLLAEGMEVTVVPPALKGPRSVVVRRVAGTGLTRLVSFSGIDDLDSAHGLVGRTILAPENALPEDVQRYDAYGLIGRVVVDERWGLLGHIDEVLRGPTQDVWVVRGSYGEVLVPAVDAFVSHVPEQGDIVVDLPEGLVDGEGE